MPRNRRLIWLVLVLVAIILLGSVGYIRGNGEWQEGYRNGVSQGIVRLLQSNPYDQTAVVVIVIDGLRWEEGLGARDRYIPHIWNDLRPLGTTLTNYRIVSPTATTSSHSAMLTGRISTVPNDGHIRPVFPTFIEYFRDARSDYVESALEEITRVPPGIFRPNRDTIAELGRLVAEARDFPPQRTALYLGKDLIYSLDQSSSGRYPADDVFLIDNLRDMEVEEYFRAKIPDVHPDVVAINLGEVDECGHEADWYYYVDAVRWADRHVWNMWLALQAETRYRDKTYFIVTTDHGRHDPSRGGFPHHGCFCEGCQHSFMVLIGPGIRQGYVSNQPHSELDLAPTIGRAIGFDTPACVGEPMTEIFEDPDSLPAQRETPTTALVEKDRERVDSRDAVLGLLESIDRKIADGSPDDKIDRALGLLAIAARLHVRPDEVERWSGAAEALSMDAEEIGATADLVLAYPMYRYEMELASSGNGDIARAGALLRRIFDEAERKGIFSLDDPSALDGMSVPEISLIAPAVVSLGSVMRDRDATRYVCTLLLNTLAHYENVEEPYAPGLEDFIDDYNYRQGPNEIFAGEHGSALSIRDRMWLVWSLERVLAEADRTHIPDLEPFLERQYRLLVAFMNEWQDANAMVGGTGDLEEGIDFVAQGLALAALAEFKPWRRWELDELGYSRSIYATPLFAWPKEHLFYLLGQANALAGGWAANERVRLFIEDDWSIRHDLVDSAGPITPDSPGYIPAAAALAYGMSRFELADYDLFDLEIYPIVRQQDSETR